ncbi:hypothetical protein [Microbulbifer hydrolyticus]|uniref:Uncharacterized protein n=1 Tax=Microbulbifer hydrolyticus TaxID=48074 RepID=A0A6P1TCF9_9GAMM|nr:hypothetical protein [Microbulbifer hydrolyticus]MBB5213104.1 hypothetical protein [Microbulbifer hydrolyticus]QHQ40458.1 hypothetical protein GTQ55_16735 [Microbulbifer hydrolyticus]
MEDPQKIWSEYYERILNRKIDESKMAWEQLHQDGVSGNTIFALDFEHFGNDKESIEKQSKQLSENYEVDISGPDEKGYFQLTGTTRPYGVEFEKSDFIAWVEFMCEVSQSYGCVFSTWKLESPKMGKSWSNADFESERYS